MGAIAVRVTGSGGNGWQAESAIEEAKALQLLGIDAEASAVRGVTNRLRERLPSDDPFWPRWIAFAESFGVGV